MIWRGQRALAALLLTIFALCGVRGAAEAHGGGPGLDYDPCTRPTGSGDSIHFAAYQPRFNPFAEYCDTLPQSGTTLLVFDLMGTDLTDDPLSLAVVRDDGAIHLQAPAQRYRAGVAKLEANLPPGSYTVFVHIIDPHGLHRLAFPVRVGAWWAPLLVPLFFTLMITVAAISYCVYQMKRLTAEQRRLTLNNLREIAPHEA